MSLLTKIIVSRSHWDICEDDLYFARDIYWDLQCHIAGYSCVMRDLMQYHAERQLDSIDTDLICLCCPHIADWGFSDGSDNYGEDYPHGD